MTGWASRKFAIGLLGAALTLAATGVAVAGVSDGAYSPERQGCTGHADDFATPDRVEEGCQNITVNLRDGAGNEAVRVGTQQTAEGEMVREANDPYVDPAAFDPATGASAYIGADDNLNNGEHDSSSQIGDGPSDGGAILVEADPVALQRWIDALAAGDSQYLLTHPIPLLAGGTGACADGVCFAIQTQRRVAYQGGAPEGERSVADYEGMAWDPESCAGPSDGEEDCGPGGISTWHNQRGTTYVDPGVQVYEDPNPAGSPLGPYPIPAAYAGTCGVVVGGGPAAQVPASPVTNGAGQVDVATGC